MASSPFNPRSARPSHRAGAAAAARTSTVLSATNKHAQTSAETPGGRPSSSSGSSTSAGGGVTGKAAALPTHRPVPAGYSRWYVKSIAATGRGSPRPALRHPRSPTPINCSMARLVQLTWQSPSQRAASARAASKNLSLPKHRMKLDHCPARPGAPPPTPGGSGREPSTPDRHRHHSRQRNWKGAPGPQPPAIAHAQSREFGVDTSGAALAQRQQGASHRPEGRTQRATQPRLPSVTRATTWTTPTCSPRGR